MRLECVLKKIFVIWWPEHTTVFAIYLSTQACHWKCWILGKNTIFSYLLEYSAAVEISDHLKNNFLDGIWSEKHFYFLKYHHTTKIGDFKRVCWPPKTWVLGAAPWFLIKAVGIPVIFSVRHSVVFSVKHSVIFSIRHWHSH